MKKTAWEKPVITKLDVSETKGGSTPSDYEGPYYDANGTEIPGTSDFGVS